jgi:hypothetical protein
MRIKPIPPVVPEPQHLSNTETPLTNDPLWLESFVIEGDRGYVEDAGVQKFTVTADSFVSLVQRTYETVSAADKEFSRHVSQSMYLYYNTMHFWGRIAAIRVHTGLATEDEQNLRRYLASKEYPVHEPINAYLRGIGDFNDPTGGEHQFKLLRLPSREEFEGIGGYFGRVSSDTHYLYESLPSPGVAARRVAADLQFTTGQGQYNWNLPDEIRPAEGLGGIANLSESDEDDAIPEEERVIAVEVHEALPTANLLGWGPSVRLTHEQRQALEHCGIQEEGFADSMSRFALNNGLFEFVSGRVRSSVDRYKCGASLHEHQGGSVAQCAYVERKDEEVPFSRTKLYCEGSIRSCTAFQTDARISVVTRVMAYRHRKEKCGNRHNWCCYDFNRYESVPETWIATRNSVFTYGQVTKLNAADKFTAFTEKDRLRTPLLTSGVVNKSSF